MSLLLPEFQERVLHCVQEFVSKGERSRTDLGCFEQIGSERAVFVGKTEGLYGVRVGLKTSTAFV